jgi:hypothetical protein
MNGVTNDISSITLPHVGPSSPIYKTTTADPRPAPDPDPDPDPDLDPTPATVGLTRALFDAFAEEVVRPLQDAILKLRAEVAAVTAANAELKSQLVSAESKAAEAFHCWERAAALSQGPRGERGPPGADGREGRPGATGPRGARGQKSEICAWAVQPVEYRAVPIYQDDTEGPALNLRSLFERYHHETGADDDLTEAELETEKLGLERARTELVVEKMRQPYR